MTHLIHTVARHVISDFYGQTLLGSHARIACAYTTLVVGGERERRDVVRDDLAPLHENVRDERFDFMGFSVKSARDFVRVRQLSSVDRQTGLVDFVAIVGL